MTECSDLIAISAVSNEAKESQTKVILANECIKSQHRILIKLRQECRRQKDACNNLTSNNLKLEAEIRNAENERASLLNSIETINRGNIELKKELLLTEIKHSKIFERINENEKKYEDLLLQSKKRFESVPHVQKCMQETKKYESLKDTLNSFENEAKYLNKEIEKKRLILSEFDKKQIIQLAEFLVHKMPQDLTIIKEKAAKVMELEREIERIIEEQANGNNSPPVKLNKTETGEGSHWPTLNNDDSLLMPKLRFANVDLDVFSVKLLQIKNAASDHIAPINKANTTKVKTSNKEAKAKLNDDYTSAYFMKFISETEDYENRKIINILQDIQLDPNEVKNIVSNVSPEKLQAVTTIGADCGKPVEDSVEPTKDKHVSEIETEDIEQIDLTIISSQNILIPPTQFLDTIFRQNNNHRDPQEVEVSVHMPEEGSQFKENMNKKKVSFHLPLSIQEIADDIVSVDVDDKPEKNENQSIEIIDSEPNINTTDANYIKDITLRKRNLDLSPQFIYARKPLVQKNNDHDKVVTSKFFNQDNFETDKAIAPNKDVTDANAKQTDENIKSPTQTKEPDDRNAVNEEADIAVTSPKEKGPEKSISEFLFRHADHGIEDSLNFSISTTGYEDGNADFPSGLDRSLLLSPTADLPLCDDNTPIPESQEVPNFLKGYRKRGLSFFRNTPSSEANPETSAQKPENNFNFNFGGEEKKKKTGIFNFFR